MEFELIPVLEKIKDLYKLPLAKRFDHYLFLLQGESKQDMILPISGFNPLAKQLGKDKLNDLISLQAEAIAKNMIDNTNAKKLGPENLKVQVALNLIDNIDGAWSNFYTTDYKSKFDIADLVKRNFCTACFWTSEDVNIDLIKSRVQEYLLRYIHTVLHGLPETLDDMLKQEVFVASLQHDEKKMPSPIELDKITTFYDKHQTSSEYDLIFNFFYGDKASETLSQKCYGFSKNTGFNYAQYIGGLVTKQGFNQMNLEL